MGSPWKGEFGIKPGVDFQLGEKDSGAQGQERSRKAQELLSGWSKDNRE